MALVIRHRVSPRLLGELTIKELSRKEDTQLTGPLNPPMLGDFDFGAPRIGGWGLLR
jgi:hypothetical protein